MNYILNKVIVVIPIYRLTPSENELKSLMQCIEVLGSRPICFFCSHDFDTSFYEELCLNNNIIFRKETFDSKYFISKEGYNDLCLEKKFYTRFRSYEFILIYQLDAWIFRDDLDFWCNQKYDYLGAPFPIDFNASDENVVFSVVGNGGFSLRRVKVIISALSGKNYVYNWSQLVEKYAERAKKNPFYWLYCILRFMGYRNVIPRKGKWEDDFFSQIGIYNGEICLPTANEALRFSFEYKPSAAFKQNGNELPMGCHGWDWIEYEEFWKNYIK
jgi:Protein of unknown function (DUF5672)